MLEQPNTLKVSTFFHRTLRDLKICELFHLPDTTKKVLGLEWGPLSLVSTTEELLDRKVGAPV
jgi:hypothetical protein